MAGAGAYAWDWAAAFAARGGAVRERGAGADLPLTELEALEMPASRRSLSAGGEAAHAADLELEKLAASGATILTWQDEAYPLRLLEIYDPPAVLWVRGDVRLLSETGIAVVGTRHPTPYGAGMAEMLARDLAKRRADDFERDGAGGGHVRA